MTAPPWSRRAAVAAIPAKAAAAQAAEAVRRRRRQSEKKRPSHGLGFDEAPPGAAKPLPYSKTPVARLVATFAAQSSGLSREAPFSAVRIRTLRQARGGRSITPPWWSPIRNNTLP